MRPAIILCLLLSAQIASAARIAHLRIYCREHHRFTIYLNEERQNSTPRDSVRILNLGQDFYRLRIEFDDTTLRPIEKKVFQLTDANGYPVDATYELRQNKKGEMSLNFLSQTIWPSYIDPGKPEPTAFPGSITASIKKKESNSSLKAVPSQTAPTPDKTECKDSTLSDQDYHDAFDAIASVKDESTRMATARQIVSSNCITINNLLGIARLFYTDERKLEIAGYAYTRLVDRGMFFKIKSQLRDQESFEKLMKAVSK